MHLAFTIMLTFLLALSLRAQDPDIPDVQVPHHEKAVKRPKDSLLIAEVGFYSGYGWNSRGCSQCYEEQWTGGWILGIKMGVKHPKRYAASVIIHYWMVGSDLWKQPNVNIEDKRNTIFLHLAGQFYPFRNPFFLKGSAGLTIFNFTPTYYLTLDNGNPMFETISNVGMGFSLGLGRDFTITKKVELTSAVDYLYHPFRQLKGDLPNEVVSGAFGSNNLYLSLSLNILIPNDVP